MGTITVAGKTVEVDKEGFLENRSDWNEEIAKEMAKADNCELSDNHWEVIHFMREYYEEHQTSPHLRVLTKAIAKKHAVAKKLIPPNKGIRKYLYKLFRCWYEQRALREALREASKKYSVKYLYELFPYGPAKQANRYADLPKLMGTI